MGSTRLRYTMLGFIIGVALVFITEKMAISSGLRFAFPFYGAGLGILTDGIILRIKQRRGKGD